MRFISFPEDLKAVKSNLLLRLYPVGWSSLTDTANSILLVLSTRMNQTSRQVGPFEWCCSLMLYTLVWNSRNLWIWIWNIHEQNSISLRIVQGTKAKKTAEHHHPLWDSPFDGQGGRSSGWSSLDFPWGSHNRPCFLWEAEEEERRGCRSWTYHWAPGL